MHVHGRDGNRDTPHFGLCTHANIRDATRPPAPLGLSEETRELFYSLLLSDPRGARCGVHLHAVHRAQSVDHMDRLDVIDVSRAKVEGPHVLNRANAVNSL